MNDTNMRLLRTTRAAAALADNDLILVRQVGDTEDRVALASQLPTYLRPSLYATAGQGISIKSGTNARIGTATLAAGTVTVANTSVTANTQVYLNGVGAQSNAGFLSYTVSAGVGFTVTSSNVTHAGNIVFLLVEST